MYYDWIQQHKRTIALCVIVCVVSSIAWSIATYVTRVGKTGVTITAVPADATITVNGNKVKNGTHWLTPGTYKVTATKDGFIARTKSVAVTNEKNQNVVTMSLSPQSDTAKRWADAHDNEYKKNEEYGAIEARANGEYFVRKNPVTNVLPYTDPYYEIAYKRVGDDVRITIATSSPRYRYLAVQKFRDLGFNPTDFRIIFQDFKNPLEVTP